MSWKRERDGLIAQTLAFVQSVTGKRDETPAREVIAPLSPDTKERPSVDAAALMAVETALGAATPSAPQSAMQSVGRSAMPRVAPNVAPQRFDPPRAASQNPPAPPVVQRPIVQSEMASEIRARVASFRAHQERFNREREEYFAATLARLRASLKDAPPPPPRLEK